MLNIDRQYHSNVLVKRLRRIEKDMSDYARTLFSNRSPTETSASSLAIYHGRYAKILPAQRLFRPFFSLAGARSVTF
jgi:hypothetical protein